MEKYKIIGGDTLEMLASKVNQELSNDPAWKIGTLVVTVCGKCYQVLYKEASNNE